MTLVVVVKTLVVIVEGETVEGGLEPKLNVPLFPVEPSNHVKATDKLGSPLSTGVHVNVPFSQIVSLPNIEAVGKERTFTT